MSLAGLRVILVEDEIMVALLVGRVLTGAGCVVVGPYGTVAEAMVAARHEKLDLGVLDVNLAGKEVFPVAEILEERGIPFVLLSGYGDSARPANRSWPLVGKPFRSRVLIEALTGLARPV